MSRDGPSRDPLLAWLRSGLEVLRARFPRSEQLRVIVSDAGSPEVPAWQYVLSTDGRDLVATVEQVQLPAQPVEHRDSLPVVADLAPAVPIDARRAAVLRTVHTEPLKALTIAHRAGVKNNTYFRALLAKMTHDEGLLEKVRRRGYRSTPKGKASLARHGRP